MARTRVRKLREEKKKKEDEHRKKEEEEKKASGEEKKASGEEEQTEADEDKKAKSTEASFYVRGLSREIAAYSAFFDFHTNNANVIYPQG